MANLHEVDQLSEGYLLDDGMVVLTTTPATSTENSTILGAKNNDMHLLGQGTLLQIKVNDNLGDDHRYKFERNKVTTIVNLKGIRLLKKLNQGAPQVNPHQMKVRSIQRSLSIGSPRTPPIKKGDELKLKLERFKMRTIIIHGSVEQHDQAGSHGGQGANTKSGSST